MRVEDVDVSVPDMCLFLLVLLEPKWVVLAHVQILGLLIGGVTITPLKNFKEHLVVQNDSKILNLMVHAKFLIAHFSTPINSHSVHGSKYCAS